MNTIQIEVTNKTSKEYAKNHDHFSVELLIKTLDRLYPAPVLRLSEMTQVFNAVKEKLASEYSIK